MTRSRTLFNPFPGLRPFQSDEDHLFFGREREIDELLRRLRTTRFLQVIGSSGSGKSSLVRSGLIPALYSGFMSSTGSSWRVLVFRPGDDPIGNLATSLNEPSALGMNSELASTNRVLLEATLRRGTLGLVNAVRQAHLPSDENLLIVVDQFEELFRFRRNKLSDSSRDEAGMFFKLLLEAARQDQFPIYIVSTMRSDFIGDCIEFEGLPEAVNEGLYLVPRMTRDELRSAIAGPVAVGGGRISQRLVLRMLNDLGDNHDQLPLLQHALMRTWDHWERQHELDSAIDITDYEAVGTLQNALSIHAEEAYHEAGGETESAIVKQTFKALTDTFSDIRGVRRPTSIQELAMICGVGEDAIVRVVEIFRCSGRSFLTPHAGIPLGAQSIIDISHESLMRCWGRLVRWAEEERESARAYIRISQAASWHEESIAGLWTDPQLEVGLQWRSMNRPTAAWAERYDEKYARAMAFLDRSEEAREAHRQKERRRKRARQIAIYGLTMLLAVVGTLLYFVRSEQERADQNLSFAKKAVDESLMSVANKAAGREAADIPELQEVERELLGKARDFYTSFARQKPRNDEFRVQVAVAHARLGDVDRLLSLRQDAIQEYKQSIVALESLVRQHSDNSYDRQMLAYSHHWLAESLRLESESRSNPSPSTQEEAAKHYDIALTIQRALHSKKPSNAEYQQELARTYINRGILYYDRKAYDLTANDFRQAIDLLEPLAAKTILRLSAAEESHQSASSQDLARVYNNLGNLLSVREKRYSDAAKLIQRAIDISESLRASDPANREYQQELAQFYYNLAAVLYNNDQIVSSQQADHRAFDIFQKLAQPNAALAEALAKAAVLQDLIDRQALQIGPQRLRAEQHPRLHVMYMALGQSYAKIAEEYLKSGELAEAEGALANIRPLLPKLDSQARDQLFASYTRLMKNLRDKRQK